MIFFFCRYILLPSLKLSKWFISASLDVEASTFGHLGGERAKYVECTNTVPSQLTIECMFHGATKCVSNLLFVSLCSCDGACMRSFHPTIESGWQNKCPTLRLTRAAVSVSPFIYWYATGRVVLQGGYCCWILFLHGWALLVIYLCRLVCFDRPCLLNLLEMTLRSSSTDSVFCLQNIEGDKSIHTDCCPDHYWNEQPAFRILSRYIRNCSISTASGIYIDSVEACADFTFFSASL